jgi:hypothetical protein
MLYIAEHLLATSRAAISESQLKILRNQAEKCAMELVQEKSAQSSLNSAQALDLLSPMQSAIVRYTGELYATINRHCDSVLQLLKLSVKIRPLPDFFPLLRQTPGCLFSHHIWSGYSHHALGWGGNISSRT